MSAMTSFAWSRLMSAPWGRFDTASVEAKRLALAEYSSDWEKSEYNPKNVKPVKSTEQEK